MSFNCILNFTTVFTLFSLFVGLIVGQEDFELIRGPQSQGRSRSLDCSSCGQSCKRFCSKSGLFRRCCQEEEMVLRLRASFHQNLVNQAKGLKARSKAVKLPRYTGHGCSQCGPSCERFCDRKNLFKRCCNVEETIYDMRQAVHEGLTIAQSRAALTSGRHRSHRASDCLRCGDSCESYCETMSVFERCCQEEEMMLRMRASVHQGLVARSKHLEN